MTSSNTTASLIRWGTAVAAVVAFIGLVGVGLDRSWGSAVSMIACAIALLGVVLLVVVSPTRRTSPGRR